MHKNLRKIPSLAVLLTALLLVTGCAGSAGGSVTADQTAGNAKAEISFEETADQPAEEEKKQETTEKSAAPRQKPAGGADGSDQRPETPEAPKASEAKTADQPEKEKPEKDEPKPEEHETPKPTEPEAPKPETPEVPQPEAQAPEPPAAPEPSKPRDNGRILFIGDSRTIDLFADSDDELVNFQANGIAVYARHGYGYSYMVDVVNSYGWDNFDTLVTWMGANDHGDFSNYGPFYEQVLNAGKNLIVCTVGPTQTDSLEDEDRPYYSNDNMTGFNYGLVTWAADHGVRIIDTYNYIAGNIQIDPDGVHYLPRPTTSIWNYILSSL
ncbi:MAG: hypothetical protein J5496_08845 [Lachnospiraceae bacterium]|nr:hypothetical protein [Lachnospiraceae bacterium]